MAPPFSQPQDWKYQCGTREGLPSAQCTALLETNVALRRILNLYNLSWERHKHAAMFNRGTFHTNKKKKKKSPLCSLCFLERNRKKDNGEFFFFLGIHCFFLHFRHAQFLHDF